MDLPEKIYSKTDVENARTKGQVVGWLQGGGVVLGGLLLLKSLGWLLPVLVVGGIGYLGYRFFFKRSSTDQTHDSGLNEL